MKYEVIYENVRRPIKEVTLILTPGEAQRLRIVAAYNRDKYSPDTDILLRQIVDCISYTPGV